MTIFRAVCILWLISVATFGSANNNVSNRAVINLTERTWGDGEIHSLAGKWDFYWGEFIDPKVNRKAGPRENLTPGVLTKISVPGAWDDKRTSKVPFPPMGYASYRIQIQVPKSLTHLYLYMPDMASAYRLWSNGYLVDGNGTIGTSRELENPAYLPKVLDVFPQNGLLDLVIHTSNYHYQWGGIWYEPLITDDSGVFAIREKPLIGATIFSSLLIGAALFSMALFLSRRQDKKVLFFSLLSLTIGIRRLLIDERALYLFDWFDWSTLQAIENIGVYLTLPLFLYYFAACFPNEINKIVPRIGTFFATPFCLAALFTPVHIYTQFNVPFQASLLVLIPYVFYTYIKVLKANRSGAKMFGSSLLIFALAVINDALNYSYLIDTPNMIHVGALAFVLFQLALLIRRYLVNFKTIETISAELTQRNRELVRLDEFKDEFLATTSHELRTPLHGIAGLAQLLRQESDAYSDSQRHKIDLIESTTKRLGTLVNDVLDFSSIKHGKLTLKTGSLHLTPLAESVIHTLKPLLKGKNVALSCHIDADACYVKADEHRLQQILFNLIGNAIKFTDQGSIRLSAVKANAFVKIVIQDTGAGIPPDQVGLLFQPFEQYLKEGSKITSGSGLGLSITRQLVRLHQGELDISSIEGEGTCVEFTLPMGEAGQSRSAHPIPQEIDYEREVAQVSADAIDIPADALSCLVANNEPALIFYADDEEVNRELVRSQLSQAGYQINTFINGTSLLQQLKDQKPDLILLDLLMPGINGLETCRQIRAQFNLYQIPIMMLTARYQISDIVEALSAGANDYLVKPYHEKELLARVYSQLSVKRFKLAAEENEKLKSELDRRDSLELELTKANVRLQQALNITDENILLLNEDLDIVFANPSAARLLGQAETDIPGQTIKHFIHPDSLEALRQFAHSDTSIEFSQSIQLLGNDQPLLVSVKPFIENDEHYFAIVLSDSKSSHQGHAQALLKDLTQELANNRRRIDQIESALAQVSQAEDRPIDISPEGNTETFDEVRHTPEHEHSAEHTKEIVVKTLRTALITWERYTHQSKADLAEKSRCWRVYIDGTTAKTRTLDKYLSIKTLPAKPRWRAVIKTANYVIDHCQLSAEDYQELSQMVQAIDDAYS